MNTTTAYTLTARHVWVELRPWCVGSPQHRAGLPSFRVRLVDRLDLTPWWTHIQPAPPEPSSTDGKYCSACGIHRTDTSSRACPVCADEPNEHWLNVPGYENRYEVSDKGRVRSWITWNKSPTPHFLNPVVDPKGYHRVILCRSSVRWSTSVHQLVLLTFHGPCPPGQQVRHLDGNPGLPTRKVKGSTAKSPHRQRPGDVVKASHAPLAHPLLWHLRWALPAALGIWAVMVWAVTHA